MYVPQEIENNNKWFGLTSDFCFKETIHLHLLFLIALFNHDYSIANHFNLNFFVDLIVLLVYNI